MKQCPQCRTTYTDDTLLYCLSDGTPLAAMPGSSEAETVISYNPAKPMVFDIPRSSDPGPSFEPVPFPRPAAAQKSGLNPMLVAGIVGVLVLVIATLGAVLIFQYLAGRETAANTSTAAIPTASKTPEMRLSGTTPTRTSTPALPPANVNVNTAPPPTNAGTTVTAYSPGDGYLVLRSQPNTSSTEMTRISHGNTFTLDPATCQGYATTKTGSRGRWCYANYNGIKGWVFDAFVKY